MNLLLVHTHVDVVILIKNDGTSLLIPQRVLDVPYFRFVELTHPVKHQHWPVLVELMIVRRRPRVSELSSVASHSFLRQQLVPLIVLVPHHQRSYRGLNLWMSLTTLVKVKTHSVVH